MALCRRPVRSIRPAQYPSRRSTLVLWMAPSMPSARGRQTHIQVPYSRSGLLFSALSESTVFFGSLDANMYAVDASTGKRHVEVQNGSPVYSSPTINEGTVFSGSIDGHLYALTRQQARKPGNSEPADRSLNTSAVEDGIAYFGSGDRFMYAADCRKGAEKMALPKPMTRSRLVCDRGEVVYFGSADRRVYAVDVRTGLDKWSFETRKCRVFFPYPRRRCRLLWKRRQEFLRPGYQNWTGFVEIQNRESCLFLSGNRGRRLYISAATTVACTQSGRYSILKIDSGVEHEFLCFDLLTVLESAALTGPIAGGSHGKNAK